jgi:hypothetical protein
MRALFLERNRMVARRLARIAVAAGWTPQIAETPEAVAAGAGDLLIADCFDGELLVNALRREPRLRGALMSSEPLPRALALAADAPQIASIFGRPSFDAPPAAWELLMVLRRLGSPETAVGFRDYLGWGAAVLERTIATSRDRDDAVAETGQLTEALGMPGRGRELAAELAHELIMNAMYGAPVDPAGRPKYAADRRAELDLPAAERPVYRIGCDGSRLIVQVTDPFGRLDRSTLFGGLGRGLAGGAQDRSRGGAGLGFTVCHDACVALFADVEPRVSTAVTAVIDLELNLRELRSRPRSLHMLGGGA